MINPDAIEALSFFGGIAAVAWAAAFAWAKWLAHRYDSPSLKAGGLPPVADPARLARLEADLEALTLEIERLAEGQRYTVRLLEERLPRTLPQGAHPSAPEPGRVITPH